MYLSNIFKVKKCCCCVSLRTGCLLIGYIETAGNTFGLVNTLRNNDADYYDDLISNLLMTITMVMVNVLLLFGIHKEMKNLLLPWIITKFTAYLFITIMYGKKVWESIILLMEIDKEKQLVTLAAMLIGGFTLLMTIAWYSFLCVSNLYFIMNNKSKEKKEEKKEERKEEKREEKKDI